MRHTYINNKKITIQAALLNTTRTFADNSTMKQCISVVIIRQTVMAQKEDFAPKLRHRRSMKPSYI